MTDDNVQDSNPNRLLHLWHPDGFPSGQPTHT
jgi:hypothetical protein